MLKKLEATRLVARADGALALGLIAVHALGTAWSLRLLPLDERYIYAQMLVYVAWFALMALLLALRGQGAASVGLTREPSAYVMTAALTAIAGMLALARGDGELFGRWLFYLFPVAGYEELLFRGYAYPRLAKATGSSAVAVVLTGALFGAFHHIAPMVWEGAPWQGVFSTLGGGIAGNLLLLLVYAAAGNITAAILLHAALDYAPYSPLPLYVTIAYLAAMILYRTVTRSRSSSAE